MRVISVDDLEVPTGELHLFLPTASGAQPSAIPPSFNQRYHVVASGATGGWLGVAFELTVAGAPDLAALQSAFAALVRRHETLRTSFVRHDQVVRVIHEEPCAWHRQAIAIAGDAGQRLDQVRSIIDAHTRPCEFPGYLLGALLSAEGATVITAFNHVHVDAVSLTIVVHDILAAYRGEPLDRNPSSVSGWAEHAEGSVASPDGVARWHRFLDAHLGLPRFPADLGVDLGARAPQRVLVRALLDREQATAAEDRCRAAGGRMVAGVLGACARAAADATEQQGLATILPVSTRRDPRWARSLGWFVTNVPIEVPVCESVAESIAASQSALEAALELRAVSTAEVLGTYPSPLNLDRDFFMVSYLDYRRVADAEELRAHNAQHFSASAPTGDVQVWFARTEQGLAVRVRLPDTPAADHAVACWLEDVQIELDSLSAKPEGLLPWK
ncbi:MAG TPA: condensation domain-containing protein [Solirubrobacteraceae bacterium]|jgi:hypothetical protein|nr:condensation domain-containing protein [Solirubrobacteraceae bacterium]